MRHGDGGPNSAPPFAVSVGGGFGRRLMDRDEMGKGEDEN